MILLSLVVVPGGGCKSPPYDAAPTPGELSPPPPFVPDEQVAALAARADEEFFPIFVESLRMIRARDFWALSEHFEAETLVQSQGNRIPYVFDGKRPPGDLVFPGENLPDLELDWPIAWERAPHGDRSAWFRLQAMTWLAPALSRAEAEDEFFARHALKVVRNWIVSNADWPSTTGEFAFGDHAAATRLRILIRALLIYESGPWLDQEMHDLLRTSILSHVYFLATLEKYVSWHNHGLIVDTSLIEAVGRLTHLRRRESLREVALVRGFEQIRFSFTVEGVHKEHSPCYHVFVSNLALRFKDLVEKAGGRPPESVMELIDLGAEFYTHFMLPGGGLPNVGDCTGEHTLFRGDAAAFYERHPTLLFALTSGASGERPAKLQAVFPLSGWAFHRNEWGGELEEATFALTQASFNSFGHYQEQETSFTLHAFGHDLVIDSGVHSYNREPMDLYMRKARAHNVLLVDGRDFEFDLAHTGLSGITRHLDEEKGADDGESRSFAVEMTHPHYRDIGVAITRVFANVGEAAFLVEDRYETAGTHEYSQLFQLAPGARVSKPTEDVFKVEWQDHDVILWLRSVVDGHSIVEGSLDPVQGWYFPNFNQSLPHPVLSLERRDSGDGKISTALAATTGAWPDWAAIESGSAAVSTRLRSLPRRSFEHQPPPPPWKPSRR